MEGQESEGRKKEGTGNAVTGSNQENPSKEKDENGGKKRGQMKSVEEWVVREGKSNSN